jgi:tetratricopeptide (TPR) repeat protein
MSPEQARGLKVDARTDIWSLGCVLYEMLAGRSPFEAPTAGDVIVSVLEREPPPLTRFAPAIPSELDWMVKKALRKERDERYQTGKEMLADLRSLRHQLDVDAEIERTGSPDMRVTGLTAQPSDPRQVTETIGQAVAHPTSSAEYIVSGIKSHKVGSLLVLAAIAVAVAAAVFFYPRSAPALTEKDDLLLADITNSTGDPVFDGTLKQALAVDLGQTPFLNIVSENRVRETLRRMERSPDERVTAEIGREICQRESIKALLTGSIAILGSNYVITLEALNGRTGDAIAREQIEAASKEQVITKLGEAATKLREKLGESLSSIQKFDAPIEPATTSSLEALKAYTLAREQGKGESTEAILFAKRAVELDPDFAMAYAYLAWLYWDTQGQPVVSVQYATKAFELRERVTERERFFITSMYHQFVTKDWDKWFEVTDLWKETYPRDTTVRNNQAGRYVRAGQYEKAVEQASEAMLLDSNEWKGYFTLGWAYRALGRYDEAKATMEKARARNLDDFGIHWNAYLIAFAEGDQAEMQRQLEWASGKPYEFNFLSSQSWTEMFSGRYRQSQETARRATESTESQDLKERTADIISTSAVWDALVGNCQRARAETAKALATARGVEPPIIAALALALCGEIARPQSIIDDLARRNPTSTETSAIWGPVIGAAIEIGRGNQAEAIGLLQKAKRYEMGQTAQFWPTYMRGQAYLRQGSAIEATAEFQKIIDRRSVSPAHILYPLAHLGMARAAALAGDTAKSRKAYEDFFAIWKDADADIPILLEAKKEFERLKEN